MKPMTADALRASFVNATGVDVGRIPVPGLHEVVWDDREFLGWRDPSNADRGYLAYWDDTTIVGIVVRAASTRLSVGSAICSLCQTPQPASQVTMFTAARAGVAGERGDSVGTYACADLACSLLIRISPPAYATYPNPSAVLAVRADGLAQRVRAFGARVLSEAAAD